MTRADGRGVFDVAVVGAGAAGMMAAAVAGQRGLRVVLIDHARKLAEKIRISGGGRCNFTNLGAGPANFLSQNPKFCRSALAGYTPRARSEEHTSELQSLMRISYAVFCLKKKIIQNKYTQLN